MCTSPWTSRSVLAPIVRDSVSHIVGPSFNAVAGKQIAEYAR